MSKISQKNFFLISFLPAIAYWYLEENYPIRIAIAGGLALSVLELSLEYIFTKHLHTLSKFNFGLILFLGGISLLGDEGIWFKLQPAITGVVIGGFLLFKVLKGKGFFVEMMESMDKENIPTELIKPMEIHVAILFSVYGLFMAYVAFYFSTDRWLFFKTIGFYIVFAFFLFGEFIYLRWKVKKVAEIQKKQNLFKHL